MPLLVLRRPARISAWGNHVGQQEAGATARVTGDCGACDASAARGTSTGHGGSNTSNTGSNQSDTFNANGGHYESE